MTSNLTPDWDYYFCRVDDQPAAIMLDLAVREVAPIKSMPHMAFVSVELKHPDQYGLVAESEAETINQIESHLEDEITNRQTRYVGRCATQGRCDFIFYTEQGADWRDRVMKCMQPFTHYSFGGDTRKEADWETYLQFLFPGEFDYQSIENRRVCNSLRDSGDKLTLARDIYHWAYFANAENRAAFIAETEKLGYKSIRQVDPNEDQVEYSVQVRRSDVPGYQQIDSITHPLMQLASSRGGRYAGWETQCIPGPVPGS